MIERTRSQKSGRISLNPRFRVVNSISFLPVCFESKDASQYLAAIEMLAGYKNSHEEFRFVFDWLNSKKTKIEYGIWDMRYMIKESFPYRIAGEKKEIRVAACTVRIETIIANICSLD